MFNSLSTILLFLIGIITSTVLVNSKYKSQIPESKKLQIQILRGSPPLMSKNQQKMQRITKQNRTLPVSMVTIDSNGQEYYMNPAFVDTFKNPGEVHNYSHTEMNHAPIGPYNNLALDNPTNKLNVNTHINGSYEVLTNTQMRYGDHGGSHVGYSTPYGHDLSLHGVTTELTETLENSSPDALIRLDPNLAQAIVNHLKNVHANYSNEPSTNELESVTSIQHNDEVEHLTNKIHNLQLQIDSLSNEIEQLRTEGNYAQASVLEQQEQQLHNKELALTIEEYKHTDEELRQEITNLESSEENLTHNGASDVELASIETRIGDLQVQDANVDEKIKTLEIDQLEVQIQEYEKENEQAVQENQSIQQIEAIEQKIDELRNTEEIVQNDVQIQTELSSDIERVDEKMSEIGSDPDHVNQLISLLKVKRKLIKRRNLAAGDTKNAAVPVSATAKSAFGIKKG